jgi:hypothetical protein
MGASRQIVFHDSKGRKGVHEVSEKLYARIIQIFDGSPKAVFRGSGGLGLGVPRAIKVKKQVSENQTSEDLLLIWMNCKDFSPAASSALDSVFNRPKLVRPSDVVKGFSPVVEAEKDRRFFVDFGEGIVPVFVIDFLKDPSGKMMSIFLDGQSYEGLFSDGNPGAVQVHWLPMECLRLSGKDVESRSTSSSKLANLPRILRLGEPLQILKGQEPIETLKSFARKLLNPPLLSSDTRTSTSTLQWSEEGLLPFGLLEATWNGPQK